MKKPVVVLISAICFLSLVGLVSSATMPQAQDHRKRLVVIQTIMRDIALSDLSRAMKDSSVLSDMVGKDTQSLSPSGLKDANAVLEQSIRMFHAALEKKDHLAIIGHFSDMLGNCYGCHTRYRDSRQPPQ